MSKITRTEYEPSENKIYVLYELAHKITEWS